MMHSNYFVTRTLKVELMIFKSTNLFIFPQKYQKKVSHINTL